MDPQDPPAAFTIRRLGAADAALFEAEREEAYRLEPRAFYTAPEDWALWSRSDRLAPLETAHVAGALERFSLIGHAILYRHSRLKETHKGEISNVYVRAPYRGRGVARRLLEHLIEAAADLERVSLIVSADNLGAVRLYESLGFITYGRDERAMRLGPGDYVDKLLMTRTISPS